MKNKLLKFLGCFVFAMMSTAAFAQTGSVKGVVLDDTKEGLTGASVILKGTTKGTITDIYGAFQINGIPAGTQNIVISFIGYSDEEIQINVSQDGVTDMGTITLASNAIGLNEVMVIASIGIDRKTPVAMSNIKAETIAAKIGSQEFPEILKSTPGVYATRAGGGFGDGRINIRGFESENVAVLINGVPVNDMENGRVFWSNWAGLTDATNSMQVQRGLGASKVAVPSIGGTINIISKASDREKGGSVFLGSGNDAYSKLGFSLSSGLNDNGWAFTVSGSKTQGDGYVDGTEFLGYSYFANIAKKINDQHEVTFTAVGAQQRHGQRQSQSLLSDYEESASGIKYNPDWGYKDGQVLHAEDNFYHKPQLSINHYWTISDKTDLSTAAYASFGTGGGGGTAGDFDKESWRKDGVIDFDAIVDQNSSNPTGESLAYLRASRNDHKWYGVLSSLNHKLNDEITLMGGVDLRYYRGDHFSEVTDLLGGEFAVDNSNVNNPNAALRVGDKRQYHNVNEVLWEGLFAQMEYAKDKLSGFVTLNASNTSYNREDLFQYLDSDPLQKTEWINFFGFGIKGGANYNLTDNHNVFANVGYFEKAPFANAVFLDFDNLINEQAENQKVFSYELGYGYRTSKLSANVNLYRTEWKDRTLSFAVPYTLPSGADDFAFANVLGVGALHQGVEFDASYKYSSKLSLTGMLSLGDWTWKDNVEDAGVFFEQELVETTDLFIAGLKVGDAAQTTAALGIDYQLMENLKIGADFNYYANYYADFNIDNRTSEGDQNNTAYEIPAYALFDINMSYSFDIAGLKSSLFGNIYNVGNVEYFSDARDGGRTQTTSSSLGAGYYGAGTTWNLALRVKF